MIKIVAATVFITLSASVARAQDHVHQPGMTHSPSSQRPAAGAAVGPRNLKEPGQAAFAAIQEAVAALEADPLTDWSKVSIEALRRHLIDMDNVLTQANVQMVLVPNGARFLITGTGSVVPSIQRMVAGHSTAMTPSDDWKYVSKRSSSGASLEVTSPRAADTAKIRALGFAGLMARGTHHQPHHYGMAAGTMVH